MTAPLELQGVSKRFGAVVACDAVDLTVRAGEIHGLLGENGAGKSTLMRIALGLVPRDAGTIRRAGRPVEIRGPRDAAGFGIAMVHQHFSLVEPLTVWENVVLGDRGRVDRAAACAQVALIAHRYGLPVDPLARVDRLSVGERQRVELVKCLRRDRAVLVLDEPTSVLTEAESAALFAVLRRVVRAEDRAVVLISHRLPEIIAATDRVTVLRRGRVVFHGRTADTTAPELARHMVGREIALRAGAIGLPLAHAAAPVAPLPHEKQAASLPRGEQAASLSRGEQAASLPRGEQAPPPGKQSNGGDGAGTPVVGPALRLRDLRVRPGGAAGLDGLTLDVAPGEILGLYGVAGNGQAALGDVLSGLLVPDAGVVEVAGAPVDLTRPGALHRAGVGVIPEDRHRSGVVLDLSIAANLVLTSLDAVSGRVFVSRRRVRAEARRRADEFGLELSSLDAPLRTLSGGNQQRVVLARELSGAPRVLVAAQPTRGLDVGATQDMHARLRRVAASGVGVLLISTELAEVLALASRVAVISGGRVAGVLDGPDATGERLGLLLGGAR